MPVSASVTLPVTVATGCSTIVCSSPSAANLFVREHAVAGLAKLQLQLAFGRGKPLQSPIRTRLLWKILAKGPTVFPTSGKETTTRLTIPGQIRPPGAPSTGAPGLAETPRVRARWLDQTPAGRRHSHRPSPSRTLARQSCPGRTARTHRWYPGHKAADQSRPIPMRPGSGGPGHPRPIR